MNKQNVQQQMDGFLEELKKRGKVPTLFLHSCCAPCSSYVLEYLSEYFEIIDFFYNPNISPKEEYEERLAELKRLIEAQPHKYKVTLVEGRYDEQEFYDAAKGLENEPEGGARCRECFLLRLKETAQKAKEYGADYFATTLTISPLKNAPLLNEIGSGIFSTEEGNPVYMPSDFKKKGGYARSIELSKEYGLYRQNYCGCVFSKRDALQREKIMAEKEKKND